MLDFMNRIFATNEPNILPHLYITINIYSYKPDNTQATVTKSKVSAGDSKISQDVSNMYTFYVPYIHLKGISTFGVFKLYSQLCIYALKMIWN